MTVQLSLAEIEALTVRVLVANGASAVNAAHVAANIAAAEAAGVTSHGLTWVPVFADHLAWGKVDGAAVPTVDQVSPSGLVVDARSGFAQAAIAVGTERLIPLARATGIAAMAIRNGGNCLLVGHYVERIAAAGLVAMAFVTSPKSMAPWGGAKPVFGTNPMAFAWPREGASPMVLDMASSRIARSEIRLAAEEGRAIPLGWALDPDGEPTTDAATALAGTVLPFGEHKGYGVALMVDLMASAMTGGNFSHEAPGFLGDDKRPPGTGQFFIAMAPRTFGGSAAVDRAERLFALTTQEPGVHLPGDRRAAARAKRAHEPITIARALYDKIMSRLDAGP